jgi:hypothetical protein
MSNMTLSRFAAAAGLDADGVVHLVKQVGAKRSASAQAAESRTTQAADAALAAGLYASVFGDDAAARDLPVSTPHTAMTQAQADAVYETIWPQPTTEPPNPLYDSLFCKAS